jgi:hypothetical protein
VTSLRAAIDSARQRGVLPAFSPGSIRDLAHKLGLPDPVSIRNLIRTLDSLRPPEPTKPQITVRSEGVGGAAVFIIEGVGFKPNAPSRTVTVRVVDDALATRNFQQSVDANGRLVMRQSIACISGLGLHFSATDSRPDPSDLTGVMWSNTVNISCP